MQKNVKGSVIRRRKGTVSIETIVKGERQIIEDVTKPDNVRFFRPEKKHSKGSLVSIPLVKRGYCFGVLNIDNINDTEQRKFEEHEISFFTNIASLLAEGLVQILKTQRLSILIQRSIKTFAYTSEDVVQANFYLVEQESPEGGLLLKKLISADIVWTPIEHAFALKIYQEKSDALHSHLFECAITSETVVENDEDFW